MNLFVEQNEVFREYGKRISQHNLIQIFLPIALLFVLTFVGSFFNLNDDAPTLMGGLVTHFIVILYTGVRFKIYSTTSLLAYLVLVPMIGILLWVILFLTIGYFAIIVFPLLLLYIGPSFNNTLAKWFYTGTIQTFKETLLNDYKLIDESFSNVQKFETVLEKESITPELIGSEIISYSKKGNNPYHVTSVINYLRATFIFIEKRGCLHVFKIEANTIQSLSLTTVLSQETLDNQQVATQIHQLVHS